ncbi:hypothetical protein BaRGS_00017668 [Batillaria attramentaria]|uniref:Sushi domain-containing protein n=1 Tax=Batillaria attramentaria TaxID=370345 RepID=A0ABD0KVD0_9CAEN
MCNNPPTVDNAVVQVSDYTYGSQASYTCKPGFHASDIAHPISCRENGQWDPPQFTCANMMGMGMRGMPGMQSMMSGMPGMGGTGGMSGLPAGMEGLMANVAATVMKSQLNNAAGGGGQNPMASMGLPPHLMAGQMMGGIGGGAQASLPAHLQGMAPLAPLMDPSLMGTMGLNMPGMTGAAPGGAAAPNRKPLEPEQMQELQTTDKEFWKADKEFWKADKEFWKADKEFWKADKEFWKADKEFWKADKEFWKADKEFWKADKEFWKADKEFWKADKEFWKADKEF